MALKQHVEEAADRLKDASVRIDEARAKPATLEHLQEWLGALTDYSRAVADLHDLDMEAMQENLDDLVRRQRHARPEAQG
jgi:hypothetical protein